MKWILKNWFTVLIITLIIIVARYLFWDKLKTAFSKGSSAVTDQGSDKGSMPVPPDSPKAAVSPGTPKVTNVGIGTPLQALSNVNVRKTPSSVSLLNVDHITPAGAIVGTWLATVAALPDSPDKGQWYMINLPDATFYQPQYFYVYASIVTPV